MKILNERELRSFEAFCHMSQKELMNAMTSYLKTKYEQVISTKDYIMAIGKIPVALVAHMDTVFHKPPKNIYYDRIKNIIWSPEGLGADDRAGVYSIVQIIRHGYRPTIIFTTDEEQGALGASILTLDYPELPTKLNFIIELDRRGSLDCVFYDCENAKFENYIESFGFVTDWGTFSDISIICPAWKIAGVNLSIGYSNEHSISETLHIGKMLNTIQKVENILSNKKTQKTKFKYIPSSYLYNKWYKNNSYNEDEWAYNPSYGVDEETWNKWVREAEETGIQQCAFCQTQDFDYNLFKVLNHNGTEIYMCLECYQSLDDQNNIDYCKLCHSAYMVTDTNQKENICINCQGELNEYPTN